jgi:multidrug efflux pump subunit AcrA (membrane-fusion protein)
LQVQRKPLFIGLLLLTGITALPGGCSKPEEGGAAAGGANAPARDPVPVTVRPVTVRTAQRSVEVTGTLFGEEEVTISNKVPGKIIAVYKDVGDRMAPGEELAQLLRNDYELALNQRKSALQEVLARLGTPGVPPQDFDPSTLPAVSRARSQSENARARFERGRQLFERTPPLLAEQDFADLKTAYDVARQGYEAELLTANALVGEARTRQAELAIAEQALRDTTIRAPRPFTSNGGPAGGGDGDDTAAAPATAPTPAPGSGDAAKKSFAVAARYVSVGELLSPISRMFRLVDDDPLKLRAPVREQFVGEMRVGQRALVRVDAYDREFAGEVSRISPQIDPGSRTFQIEVVIPNGEGLLRPGGFARARVETRVQNDVVFVSRDAVVTFAGVNKVFTVKDGKAQEVVVETGSPEGQDVEVVRGLKGNESVIVTGANRLATGVPVAVNAGGAAQPTAQPTAEGNAPAPRAAADGR